MENIITIRCWGSEKFFFFKVSQSWKITTVIVDCGCWKCRRGWVGNPLMHGSIKASNFVFLLFTLKCNIVAEGLCAQSISNISQLFPKLDCSLHQSCFQTINQQSYSHVRDIENYLIIYFMSYFMLHIFKNYHIWLLKINSVNNFFYNKEK